MTVEKIFNLFPETPGLRPKHPIDMDDCYEFNGRSINTKQIGEWKRNICLISIGLMIICSCGSVYAFFQ